MNYNSDYVAQAGMAVKNHPIQANARILGHPRILYGGELMADGQTGDQNLSVVVSKRANYTYIQYIFGNRAFALGRLRRKLEYTPKAAARPCDDQGMGLRQFRSEV